MTTYNIAIMVRNEYGVLNRVTSMFRRRQFNILSLTVSETETERLSRITVQYEGEERSKRQLVAQLAKLPDVISWKEFDPEDSISCELLLIKMANRNETRSQVLDAADAFRAKIVDYTRDSIVFRIAGGSRRIDNFIDLMRDFEILEVCRTGVVSLERGPSVMRDVASV
ncbi:MULTISPECIES: acetolactate synthase small subunit [Parafannyhessea]|jgi:acetolactate synthase-1/3 small subunit|uniref:Acetolactate synthase small subunit n=1 Tax=Parafannyhessea umbonata TaxID=604330 RepID=A0A1H1MVZ7_9ACTN|nr:acetolactate synthase small subunit [Parafannyhessea umbonata]MBM6989177.1 acetolactate synthase small subunit [Parafannyhessea umbonata]MCI6681485.1 acetolactate synthase small subunit [Parafannyhessea umbonata]MCI7218484.1 acetolactate synthase small subunit [Parafannyhessea umbonata]MDD6358605.1 acetolactate synthase small subunit [Parafannyhessea umbonata]MDD6565319.1 acetolactate synthase small subunit [Parafannyhessea umbonata]